MTFIGEISLRTGTLLLGTIKKDQLVFQDMMLPKEILKGNYELHLFDHPQYRRLNIRLRRENVVAGRSFEIWEGYVHHNGEYKHIRENFERMDLLNTFSASLKTPFEDQASFTYECVFMETELTSPYCLITVFDNEESLDENVSRFGQISDNPQGYSFASFHPMFGNDTCVLKSAGIKTVEVGKIYYRVSSFLRTIGVPDKDIRANAYVEKMLLGYTVMLRPS